ncbi:larval cuticle protein LCP-30-like [Coccinella septempunctata]|uniref:larval cuticle protein LCP-30-like n=1 Tax=Coccinella septempunctata TaxID=41139 RepID=UPI001D05E662|nr:larval cuticle protein LCP-30-like [Coccinella septempunctata]
MRVLILFLVALYMAESALIENDDDGSYREDNSGQYIPDDSGRYIPDYSGLYKDDGTGRYSGDKFANYGKDGRYSSANDLLNGREVRIQRANKNLPKKNIPIYNPIRLTFVTKPVNNPVQYNDRFGTSPDGRWRIIKQTGDVSEDGYNWEYETENGISAAESGKLANKGTQNEAMQASGFFTYTGPDNVIYTVTYRADENGFRPEGAHLPTPPPIPEAILKSLETQGVPRRLKS